jgi:hypothetical protein
MLQSKLILVEGIAGSGKSTIGQKLVAILRAHNISAHFIHEFDRTHPIRDVNCTDSDELIEKTISHWQAFVSEYQSPHVTIFDGILSQCFIAELMLMGTDEQKILDVVHKVLRIIEALDPRIVYLYQDDVRKAIRKAYYERSEKWQRKIDTFIADTEFGRKNQLKELPGYVSFNQVYSTLLSRIIADSDLPCITIETSQRQWPIYYKQIADFLSISSFENNCIETITA